MNVPLSEVPILEARGLTVDFPAPSTGWRRAPAIRVVDDVCLSIGRREIVGLVGESGSGKTTLSRALLRLLPASAGSVRFDGIDVLALPPRRLAALRRRMQLIFQDPYTSLNPRMTASQNIAEGLVLQGIRSPRQLDARVAGLLAQVGLPARSAARFPHEFSGGQRQRIGIARALAVEPDLIIADEPVSALDMSIQAQILNLLLEQQERRGLSMLFIGHDLSVIRHVSDRVVVMYLGRIMEVAPTAALFRRPAHPYTQALLDATPAARPGLRDTRAVLRGEVPAAATTPAEGCPFSARCPHVLAECLRIRPALRPRGDGQSSACIRDDLSPAR